MHKDQLRRRPFATIFVPCIACACIANGAASADPVSRAPLLPYEVVAKHPHDTRAFTQGLAYLDGALVESTGGFGRSEIAIREIASGAVRRRHALAKEEFGEGVTRAGERLIQLTWRNGVAFVYDLALRRTGAFTYDGEGWGLASDGAQLFMSDGSDRITRRRLADFAPVGSFRVADGPHPVARLNELEYARGRLYANVWYSPRIAVIDPERGRVEHWLDLAPLADFPRPAGWSREHVLNGIAFDPRSGHFYVTGKGWPVLYEIRVAAAPAAAR
jgi:glutaminyl-peptide cyclotransferase